MAIDKKDKKDYSEGQKDASKELIDQIISNLFGNHPDTDAYYKGRHGAVGGEKDNEKESEQ